MTFSGEHQRADSDQIITSDFSDPPVSGISNEELSELALGVGTDPPLANDVRAICFVPEYSSGLLGAWYMPPVATRRVAGWRKWVVLSIVGIFLILEALGLCSVFGQVVIG